MSVGAEGLPQGWAIRSLPEVAEIIMGQSPPGSTYNDRGEGLPFFQGKADFTDTSPIARKWCTQPSRIAQTGDILLCVRAPVGPTNIADRECAVGRGLAIIRPRAGMSRDYLRAGLRLREDELRSMGTGTTFEAVSKHHLAHIAFPVPTGDEQEMIAALLGEIQMRRTSIVDRLAAARAIVDRLRTAVLAAACSGRLTVDWRKECGGATTSEPDDGPPANWKPTRLGDIVRVATGGTPLRKNVAYYDGGTIPWVTSGAVNAGIISEPTELITPRALTETNVKLFPAGTLLIAMYGEGQTRGRVAELAIEAGTNQALAAIVFDDASAPHRPYLRLFFENGYQRMRAASLGGVQPNLSLGMFKETVLGLPPLDEQRVIVERAAAALATADRLRAAIASVESLLGDASRAAMRRAFRGDLVPTEAEPIIAGDEPALDEADRSAVATS